MLFGQFGDALLQLFERLLTSRPDTYLGDELRDATGEQTLVALSRVAAAIANLGRLAAGAFGGRVHGFNFALQWHEFFQPDQRLLGCLQSRNQWATAARQILVKLVALLLRRLDLIGQ